MMKIRQNRGINLLAIIRIVAGLLIIKHGLPLFSVEDMQKFSIFLEKIHIPMPLILAYVAKGTEFFGGLFLAFGFFTRWVSVPLIINMTVALKAHDWQITGNAELAFMYLLIFFIFLCVGGGKFSLDYVFFEKEKQKRITRY